MQHSEFLEIIESYSLQLSIEEDSDETHKKGFIFIHTPDDKIGCMGAKIATIHLSAMIQSFFRMLKGVPREVQVYILDILLAEMKEFDENSETTPKPTLN